MILFVLNDFSGGGGERSALVTARALSNLGYPSSIAVCRNHGPYRSEAEQAVPVHEIGGWPSVRGGVAFMKGLRRIADRLDPTMIVSNGFGTNQMVLAAGLAGRLRCGIVVIERNNPGEVLRSRFPRAIARIAARSASALLYRTASAIIGVSEGVANELESLLGLPTGSVRVIRNPIDVGQIRDSVQRHPPDELTLAFKRQARPILITAGRLTAQKAHDDLLRAFSILPEQLRGSLVILGDGPERESLASTAHDLGIDDRVWMPGFVANPWWFIARADVFCLSSVYEGFGRVLVESLACGTPVVATDCPSGPREILNGIEGTRVVPPRDPVALSAAIANLLSSRERVRADLDRYDPDSIAVEFAHVLDGGAPRTA